MGIQAPAEVKYGLIREAVRQDGNLLNISALCRIAGVSRSGYYAWLDAAPLRQSREETDSTDFALVKQAYEFRGYKKGARSIYMRLLHLDPPVVMNIKKIRRLMRKYGLRCPIRQANPYRQMAKAMKTSHVAKNEINRQFRSYAPRKARRKILCKRFSTKSRMALESRADSGLNPLITESHGGQNGMRAGTA